MAALPDLLIDPTLAAVDAAMEAAQERRTRPYLGMSALGNPCERALWYGFRWSAQAAHSAATLKRFEDGHTGEDVQADRLRMVAGIELHTHQPDGRQFGFEICGGHAKGHMDGAIRGLLQAPQTFHVWEHKQVGEDKFKKLAKLKADPAVGEKAALKAWNEVYYAQALLYMRCSGMERHYLTCATPGGRDTLSVRTDADNAAADALFAKAQRIIDAPEPPPGISADPSFYLCRWCDYHDHCHGTAVPLPTCRSCAHVTPIQDGHWQCERNSKTLTVPEQQAACQGHRFIPILLGRFAEAVEADTEANWIKYKNKKTGEVFINGLPPEGFESTEIHAVQDKNALGDAGVQEIRAVFDARVAA